LGRLAKPAKGIQKLNETRTTRIIALIAGNGYFLNRLAEYWMDRGGVAHFHVSVVILSVVALIGITTAYISLFGKREKRWPLILELVSALGFSANAVWWLYIIDRHSG
jgi:hypothetical protein